MPALSAYAALGPLRTGFETDRYQVSAQHGGGCQHAADHGAGHAERAHVLAGQVQITDAGVRS